MAAATFNHAAISARLETLLLTGATFITWGEISLWWNFKRIDKKPWRDIHLLWQELWDRQPFSAANAPVLRVRGTDKAAIGGVWLIRPHLPDIDGSEMMLGEEGLTAVVRPVRLPRLPDAAQKGRKVT